jgi:hypothetical protein
MYLHFGPTTAKQYRMSFYDVTVHQLHWLAAALRSAQNNPCFAADREGVELLDRFNDAIRSLPKPLQDAVQRPYKGAPRPVTANSCGYDFGPTKPNGRPDESPSAEGLGVHPPQESPRSALASEALADAPSTQ